MAIGISVEDRLMREARADRAVGYGRRRLMAGGMHRDRRRRLLPVPVGHIQPIPNRVPIMVNPPVVQGPVVALPAIQPANVNHPSVGGRRRKR